MKNSIKFLVAPGALLLWNSAAQADGFQRLPSFGVNRRVVSKTNHLKVKGKFEVTNFDLKKVPGSNPPIYLTPLGLHTHKPEGVRVNSKPTFYLGCQGTEVPAEAGFQFESSAQEETSDNIVAPSVDPGWVVFMRWHPRIPDPNPKYKGGYWIQLPLQGGGGNWRQFGDPKVKHEMELEVLPSGKLALTIAGIGPGGTPATLYSVPPKDAIPENRAPGNPATLLEAAVPVLPLLANRKIDPSKCRVRRVIGITQGNHSATVGFRGFADGSRFTCCFSQGEVGEFDPSQPTQLKMHSWTPEFVLQEETCFDNNEAIPGPVPTPVPAGTPLMVVEFPKLGPAGPARSNLPIAHGLKEDGTSRYVQETVQISLFSR